MKTPSPAYVVGQIVPMPRDVDPVHLATQRMLRQQTVRQASMNGRHPSVKAALKTQAGRAEALRRATDPMEQARTWLRRKGFCPVCKVNGVHHVGRHRMESDAAVLAFARDKGWQG